MTGQGPREFFTHDHRECDEVWSRLEAAVEAGRKDEALRLWKEFDHSMRRHFAMEEEVLFPTLEAATGMHGGGPTAVMRMEHDQMRAVLDQMAQEVAGGDLGALLDHGDTLLVLTQQHNMKEEGILYPMADQELGGQWQDLSGRLAAYE